jgi:hypothetical protein
LISDISCSDSVTWLSGQDMRQSTFTRAIRSHNRMYFPCFNLQVKAFKNRLIAYIDTVSGRNSWSKQYLSYESGFKRHS